VSALERALAALPTASADGIAAYLTQLGIRGKRADGCRCPIAAYLAAEDVDGVIVGPEGTWVDGVYAVFPSAAVNEFVLKFDAGQWPELDAPAEQEKSTP
jgi:hypothetical protein